MKTFFGALFTFVSVFCVLFILTLADADEVKPLAIVALITGVGALSCVRGSMK